MEDIPPRDIVKLTRYFISSVRRDIIEKELPDYCSTSNITALDVILTLLVSYPINHFLMQPWIKTFTQKEILVLISFLTRWIQEFSSKSLHKIEEEWNGKKIPTLHAIIRWCNLIIDSHLTMLVLVDECNEALSILNQATLNYLEIIDHMAALEGCVQHLVLQSPLPEQKEIADYSVDHFVWSDRSQFLPKKTYSDLPKKNQEKKVSVKKKA